MGPTMFSGHKKHKLDRYIYTKSSLSMQCGGVVSVISPCVATADYRSACAILPSQLWHWKSEEHFHQRLSCGEFCRTLTDETLQNSSTLKSTVSV